MPVDITRSPIGLQPISVRRAEAGEGGLPEEGFWSNLSDTYALGWMGQVKDELDKALARFGQPQDPDFDGLDYVPEGYEQYADAYMWARTRGEVDVITANIDENNAARGRLNEAGLGANLLAGLVAGVVDPTNLIGGPALRGAGFVGGFLRGGASIGTINAVTEGVRHGLDPTSTIEETAINITAGYALAGLIGGAVGKFSRGPSGGVRVEGSVNLTPEQRARVDAVSGQFERALRAVDGYVNDELIDFNGQGVRIVQGPTGKVRPDGSPVSAFFRPKEAFEAEARAAQVSRAADSALGDVVPDGDEVAMQTIEELQDAATNPALVRGPDDVVAEADAAIPLRRQGDEGAETAPQSREGGDAPEDTIFIDVEALRASYPDKPWTRVQVEGVDALPENAFKSEAEWVNFVALHELHHKTTKRLPNETKAEYENRINRLALEEVRAGRLPLSPTDSALEKLMLLPTPQGTLMRLAPRDDTVHSLFQNLAGDHATQMIANRAGRPTTPGGSVFQRAQRWYSEYFKANVAVRRGYSKYIRGYAADSQFMLEVDNLRASMPLIGTARRQGKMTFTEFNEYVGRAVFDDGEFSLHNRALTDGEMGVVREAATEIRKVLDNIEGQARELGMFNQQQRAQWEIGWRQEKIDEIKARMASAEPPTEGQREMWRSLINQWDKEIDDLIRVLDEQEGYDLDGSLEGGIRTRQRGIRRMQENLADDTPRLKSEGQLEGLQTRINEMDFKLAEARNRLGRLTDNPMRAGGDDHYWHRVYHVGRIRERYDDFVDLIAMGFARENGDANAVTDEIVARARKVADNIIGEGMEENAYGIGGLRALRSRAIPLSNKELSDFIVLDADVVMQSYVRRMGPAIEMQRAFGSRTLDKQIADLRTHAAEKGYSAETTQELVWELEAMRDRVLNQFHAKDPLSWDNRIARSLKMLAQMQVMGRGIYAQTVDIARTVAAEGYEPLFKAIHASFDRGFKNVQRGEMARLAGEAFEYASMRSMARAMEDDSALIATRQTGIERGLANLQPAFFTANLMTPFTVIWKDVTSTMTAHRLIRDSKMLADAVRSGKTLATLSKKEAKLSAELASWGIDLRTAQMIADMPVEQTDGGLWLANIGAWEGRAGEKAKDAFIGALSGNIRSNVVTPGPLQRAAIMDGVFRFKDKRIEQPLLSLPFQLLSFTMSSSAKITHSMLSGRDRNRYITMTSLLMGGMMAAYLKAGDGWEYMDWKERTYAALDNSGIFGWIMDPIKRVESITGYGPRSAMGLDQFGEGEVNAPIGAVGGPAAGVMAGLAEAMISEDMTDRRRVDLARRAIPGSGLIWWDETLKEWSRAAASNGAFEFEADDDWSMPSAFDEEVMAEQQ